MFITLNTIFYIVIGIVIGCVLSLFIAYIVLIRKYAKLLKDYNTMKRSYLRKSNQVSMMEYHYRNYKEGANAFTVLRDIGNTVQSIEAIRSDGK